MESDFCFTATKAAAEGLIIERGSGIQCVAWRDLENLRLRYDPRCARPYQLEVSFRDSEISGRPPGRRNILIDFETRTRRLFFVTRCRQLGAQVPSIRLSLSEAPATESERARQTQRTCQEGRLECSRTEIHRLSTRRRRDGCESGARSIVESKYHIGGVPSAQAEQAQPLSIMKDNEQSIQVQRSEQVVRCQLAQHARTTPVDFHNEAKEASGSYITCLCSHIGGTELDISRRFDENCRAISALSCGSRGTDTRRFPAGYDTCSAEQLAEELIMPRHPNTEGSPAGHAMGAEDHLRSGVRPSANGALPCLTPRPVQSQFDHLCHTFPERQDLFNKGSLNLPTLTREQGCRNVNEITESSSDLQRDITQIASQGDPVEPSCSANLPAQRDRLGSAWSRLIRVGSKILRMKSNRHPRGIEGGRFTAEDEVTGAAGISTANHPVLTSATSIPSNSRHPDLSMQALVSVVSNSDSASVGIGRRRWPWNGGVDDQHATRSLLHSRTETVSATEAKSVDQAAALVSREVVEHVAAAVASFPDEVTEARRMEDDTSSKCSNIVDFDSDAKALPCRRIFKPKKCWRKPVMPHSRGSAPFAASPAPAENRISSSDETSNTSFVVVSVASGERSPTSWESGATKSSSVLKDKDQSFCSTSSKAEETVPINVEGASCFSALIDPQGTISPQPFSRRMTSQASSLSVALGSKKPYITEMRGHPQGQLHAGSLLVEVDTSREELALQDVIMRQQKFEDSHRQKRSFGAPQRCRSLAEPAAIPSELPPACDSPLPTESSGSEVEVSICQSPPETCGPYDMSAPLPALKAPLLCAGQSPSSANYQSVVSPFGPQGGCDTMQYCSLPDRQPVVSADCLFARSAALEANGISFDEAGVTADACEPTGAGHEEETDQQTTRSLTDSMQASDMFSAMPDQKYMSRLSCLKSMTSSPTQTSKPNSLRDVFGRSHGRVLVETNNEDFSSISPRPNSPCSPPLGICISKTVTDEIKEPCLLRETLTALWDELEAVHKGHVELPRPVHGTPLSSAPQLGTIELFSPRCDTQLPLFRSSSPVFSKSAAHTSFLGETHSSREDRTDITTPVNPPMPKEPYSHTPKPPAVQWKNTADKIRKSLLQKPSGTAGLVSLMTVNRPKENASEQAGNWWRASLMKVANRPLLASYEVSSSGFSSSHEIQDELVPGPNEKSIFSSNWHDRLQWTFQQVLILRESQESRPASQLRGRLLDCELALSHEIGSFAAAARAAAVVLLHSLALEGRGFFPERFNPKIQELPRKGPSQCFVRITPEEYPTVWSVYQPKFASDELYVFDSLVFTVIVGDDKANIKSFFAKEVYQHDVKGRQAMTDAVYATSLGRTEGTDLSYRRCNQLRYGRQRDLGQQGVTLWNTHGQGNYQRAKLGLPIACLVDYAGLAVLVEPLLPLNPAPVNVLEELAADIRRCLPDFVRQCETIGNLLACFDALDKVDRDTYNKFKNIAQFLNLADYPFARGSSDFQMPLPPVALWRSQVDHFCIFRNLHETLPPKCADGHVVPEQRFRQTFVSHIFDVALPCTSREQHKAAETSTSKFVQRSTTLRGSLEALEVAVHSMETAIKQDLVPVINGLQKNFLDSFDIAHTLHAHGINIRNVAQLLNHGPASPFRDAIVREVVARSAKRLFRMQIEKLARNELVENTYMEEIQRLVVTLFNLVLSNNEESRVFWLHQILPLALDRYKVDLTDLASPGTVCTYSLFKAMEYNLGVKFGAQVVVRSTDRLGEEVFELRLPLTVTDLSTFSSIRDSLLFPHVSHVSAALFGNVQSDTASQEGDASDWQLPQSRSTNWLTENFFENNDGNKDNDKSKALQAGNTLEELQTFSDLRAVRGFYPRVQLVAPETFALMQAAAASCVVGASSISLDVLLGNINAGLVVPASREEIWGSGNFATHGVCGAMRSALMGTGYPCHPYCLAVDEDEKLRAKLSIADKNKSQLPLEECLRYKRKKLALTLALLVKAAIGNDILLLGKILQQTAYIMLQHNEIRTASSIAGLISWKVPDALSLQSEADLIEMQCTTKGAHPQDALMCYRNLKPVLIAMEGKMSLRLLLADLLLASFAFKNKRFSAAILHAFRVHKISTVCFDTGGAHWAAIAALRLIARSMLEVQRCSEAIIILQHAVRAASTNPELPTLVTHMSKFWLAAAFARMGCLENASVEAQSMLAGLESQLGTNHEATMSALYLAADIKMRIGCLALQNPPLNIEGQVADECDEVAEVSGAPCELQEPLLWKPLRAEDFRIYEGIFRDRSMIQARADAEQLFLALFQRLLFREDNVLVEVYRPPGLERKQRLRQIFSTLKQILKLKLCSLPVSVLRLLANRIYVACVAHGCSTSLRQFGLMEQEQIASVDESTESDDEKTKEDERRLKHKHLSADRTRVYFTRYPRLRVGWRPTSATSTSHAAEAEESQEENSEAMRITHQEQQGDLSDYPFSFYSQQKVSGTERRRVQGNNFLYACVDGSSGMRPTQEHDDVMLQLLLFCEGPPSLNGVLKSCYMTCVEDRERNPSTWMDDLISDVLRERGSLQHLRFLVCMLRHFFTLSQKSLFIALAPGDLNRKRRAQILIHTMRGQHIEGDVSRKLVLKRMVNKHRERKPDSTEDYFEYEVSSPREFDLLASPTRCEELLNATTWTGSALRHMRSQLDFTISKQLLTKAGPGHAWQASFGGEDDLVESAWAEAVPGSKAASGANALSYRRGEMTSVQEGYLKLPAIGRGNISGKTRWKSMSTAARLSRKRFGGNNQLIANVSPVAYGVMRNILQPQEDSELEAFGCIECLQPPDKVPYLGG